jgi:hypothetical protein
MNRNRLIRIVLCVLALFVAMPATAQSVLKGYKGFWQRNALIKITDLLKFPDEELPYLRNEIYARYGRAFETAAFQEYFNKKPWYKIANGYKDAWIPAAEKANADLLLTLEKPAMDSKKMRDTIMKNLEYSSKTASFAVTGGKSLNWMDPDIDFGMYGTNGARMTTMEWTVWGDWIIIYTPNQESEYSVIAYSLDHKNRTIKETYSSLVDSGVFKAFLNRHP